MAFWSSVRLNAGAFPTIIVTVSFPLLYISSSLYVTWYVCGPFVNTVSLSSSSANDHPFANFFSFIISCNVFPYSTLIVFCVSVNFGVNFPTVIVPVADTGLWFLSPAYSTVIVTSPALCAVNKPVLLTDAISSLLLV